MKKKRKKKTACARNSLRGLVSAPDVPDRGKYDAASFAGRILGMKSVNADVRSINIDVAEGVTVSWEAVISGRQMFVRIPNVLAEVGSKESFVTLLEMAEEDFDCEHVICCLSRTSSELSGQIHSFRFMGFQPVPPDSPLIDPGCKEKFILLGYEL